MHKKGIEQAGSCTSSQWLRHILSQLISMNSGSQITESYFIWQHTFSIAIAQLFSVQRVGGGWQAETWLKPVGGCGGDFRVVLGGGDAAECRARFAQCRSSFVARVVVLCFLESRCWIVSVQLYVVLVVEVILYIIIRDDFESNKKLIYRHADRRKLAIIIQRQDMKQTEYFSYSNYNPPLVRR